MFKRILCLDSSTSKHLVLRLWDGDRFFDATTAIDSLESDLINSIDSLLFQAQIQLNHIELFILGAGPGSFMGLRLGFSVFRTWSWLYKTPITMISSLNLLSFHCQKENTLVVPCIDAKMKKVFCKMFLNNQPLTTDLDLRPEELAQEIYKIKNTYDSIVLLGSGSSLILPYLPNLPVEIHPEAQILPQHFNRSWIDQLDSSVLTNWDESKLRSIEPLYLRLSAAEEQLRHNPQ